MQRPQGRRQEQASGSGPCPGRETVSCRGACNRKQRVGRDAPRTRDGPRPERSTERQRETQPPANGADTGRRTSALTGLHPWIGRNTPERASVWTVAGYRASGLLLSPGGGAPIETGLSRPIVAADRRSELVPEDNGFELAFKADSL